MSGAAHDSPFEHRALNIRSFLAERRACIPRCEPRKTAVKYDKRRYKKPQSHRNHLRTFEKLGAGCNVIRQIPNSLSVRNRTYRNRHLLAMSPDPYTLFPKSRFSVAKLRMAKLCQN